MGSVCYDTYMTPFNETDISELTDWCYLVALIQEYPAHMLEVMPL